MLRMLSLEGPPIQYGMLLALSTATTKTRPPLGPAVLTLFVHSKEASD